MRYLVAALFLVFLLHLLVYPSWRRARGMRCSLKDCLVFDLTAGLCVIGWNRPARWLMLHMPPTCKRCRRAAADCAEKAAQVREAAPGG